VFSSVPLGWKSARKWLARTGASETLQASRQGHSPCPRGPRLSCHPKSGLEDPLGAGRRTSVHAQEMADTSQMPRHDAGLVERTSGFREQLESIGRTGTEAK
jgi:hypothetical protein